MHAEAAGAPLARVAPQVHLGDRSRVDRRPFVDDLRVEVVDEGASVDPRTVPEVDLRRYASERRTGGLGVHLMGRIMDTVTFRRAGHSNVCCMVKRKPDPGRGAAP